MTTFTRAFPLDDIQIRSGGDGRTVEAYAAVFDYPTEIVDAHGHYNEQLSRTAFDRSVGQRGTRFGVFYNHGKTLYGTPSERASIPLGSPIEPPRADGRGLLTVTRYNKTEQADMVLECIRNGDIRGQSFSGRFIGSDKPTPRGGFKASRSGELALVTRTEIAMTEYGPTPIPAYDVPMVVGVRSQLAQLVENGWDPQELVRLLSNATPPDEGDPAEEPATPIGPGAEDPLDINQHSGRQSTAMSKLRWKARQMGVL